MIKKFGLICLGLASLTLVGCFHIPDKDWLPSKNKVETGNIVKDEEMEKALDSFMNGINMVKSEGNEAESNENYESIEVENNDNNETGDEIEINENNENNIE